jgi:hypothetical protein
VTQVKGEFLRDLRPPERSCWGFFNELIRLSSPCGINLSGKKVETKILGITSSSKSQKKRDKLLLPCLDRQADEVAQLKT